MVDGLILDGDWREKIKDNSTVSRTYLIFDSILKTFFYIGYIYRTNLLDYDITVESFDMFLMHIVLTDIYF